MKTNKIKIIINKSVREVFDFTTDPGNTSFWIPSIREEEVDEYPLKIGTIYRNKGDSGEWDSYKVVEFEANKVFTLKSLSDSYYVRYIYEELGGTKTEMVYFEWVEEGELEDPFKQETLQKLKEVMEG